MFLKPQPGVDVPDVDRGGLLPAEGREVITSTYWQRRIDDGDVDVAEVKPVDAAPMPVATAVAPDKK